MNFLGHQSTIFLEFVELLNILPFKNALILANVINFRFPRGSVENWKHKVQNACVLFNLRVLSA